MRHFLIAMSMWLFMGMLFTVGLAAASALASTSAEESATAFAEVGHVITVTTTSDETDSNGSCSLREALQAAATDSSVDGCGAGTGGDTIVLPGGIYQLSMGQLVLSYTLTLQGSLSNTTILDGNQQDRVLYINQDANVTLRHLAIRNGSPIATMDDSNFFHGQGGGIANYGATLIAYSTIYNNRATLGGSYPYYGGGADGGGIYNNGFLTLTNSTISGNAAGNGELNGHAGDVYCGPIGDGGGIANFGTLVLDNATIANNQHGTPGNCAESLVTDAGQGGGLYNYPGSEYSAAGSVSMRNSLVAGNQNSDCSGPLTSLGYNVIERITGCTVSGSYVHWAAALAPLQENGGPTPTHALLAKSAAIDAGSCIDSANLPVTIDQRGAPRPQAGNCDIGAFESPFTSTFVIRSTALPRVLFHPAPCGLSAIPCNLTNSIIDEEDPAWSPDGHKIAFHRFIPNHQEESPDTGLFVINSDGAQPVRLTDNAWETKWSPDGSKLAFTCCMYESVRNIYSLDADGSHMTNLTNRTDRSSSTPMWSPDGQKILFSVYDGGDGGPSLYVMNADGSQQTMIAGKAYLAFGSPWSPDSSKITYYLSRIIVINADGSDPLDISHFPPEIFGLDDSPTWSPTENKIAFVRREELSSVFTSIYVVNADGSQPTRLTDGAVDHNPRWSPDGRKILYQRQEFTEVGGISPTYAIMVMNADGSDNRSVVASVKAQFSGQPVWSPDGRQIAFVNEYRGNDDIFVVALTPLP